MKIRILRDDLTERRAIFIDIERKIISGVRKLVVHECSNYYKGTCILKNKACQWKAKYDALSPKGITCLYLVNSVLPLNKELCDEYHAFMITAKPLTSKLDDSSVCEYCGKPIIKKSNRQKYCSECRGIMERRNHAAKMRDYRALEMNKTSRLEANRMEIFDPIT